MPQTFDLPNVLDIPDLPKYLKQVEACINDSVGAERSKMTNAVIRLTKARGKRLRPALVIASALLADEGINSSVIKTAAAVELIHIGSLVHDDIIDESSTRWNIPTINAREGLNYAIIGGDFLFAKACVLAGETSQEAGIIAAETITLLCKGESSEQEVQHNSDRTEAQLEKAIYGKTAALMAAACELGGISTNQPEDRLEVLSSFGSDFGMSFQLVDDVLDFVSTDTLMGKQVGNDIKEGIYTLPIILSLQGPKPATIRKELAKTDGSLAVLTEILLEDSSITKTIAKAEEYNRSAEQALQDVFGKNVHNLAQLPNNYLDWAFSNLVAHQYKTKVRPV